MVQLYWIDQGYPGYKEIDRYLFGQTQRKHKILKLQWNKIRKQKKNKKINKSILDIQRKIKIDSETHFENGWKKNWIPL